jgi:cell division protein FtsZ
MRQADKSLAELAGTVDTVIAIPNDRLLALVPRGTSFFEAFRLADDILVQAVQGISDIITTPGLINRDCSDIRATMQGMGYAMMGTAVGHGANAAVEAARRAISCPLLEDSRITGSRGILINITGSSQLGLHEVNEACSIIREAADCDDVQINFGVILNESMQDSVKITVIATGFQPEGAPVAERPGVMEPRIVAVPETPRAIEPLFEPELEPEPVIEEPAEPYEPAVASASAAAAAPALAFDPDDLDTPAYLRRGKLVN